jgi:hypothetical protein
MRKKLEKISKNGKGNPQEIWMKARACPGNVWHATFDK